MGFGHWANQADVAISLIVQSSADPKQTLVMIRSRPTIAQEWDDIEISPRDADGYILTALYQFDSIGVTLTRAGEDAVTICDVNHGTETNAIYQATCKVPDTIETNGWQIVVTLNDETIFQSERLTALCPIGQYGHRGKCHSCNEQSMVCEGPGIRLHALELKKGFWRSDRNSSMIYQCSFDDVCLGGVIAGDRSCFTGHRGPTCRICGLPIQRWEAARCGCKLET